jgi:hypothetical protein
MSLGSRLHGNSKENTNNIIDFTKLILPVPGEGLENLARRIGELKGF